MSTQPDSGKLSVEEFTSRCRQAMIPVGSKISYFPASPLSGDEFREYVEEPIAAVPPSLLGALPPFSILLVPYLEGRNGKPCHEPAAATVCFEPPQESRQIAFWKTDMGGRAALLFAVKDRPPADYHYHFYRAIAVLAMDHISQDVLGRFDGLLREELRGRVHGEVDHDGWRLKQALMRRQAALRRETKQFREYACQAFIDTLTLYLHGICCDIDVDPGPRQLPSRYLRKRLMLLEELFPPPEGYAVFPQDLNSAPP